MNYIIITVSAIWNTNTISITAGAAVMVYSNLLVYHSPTKTNKKVKLCKIKDFTNNYYKS